MAGNSNKAIEVLQQGLEIHPYNIELLYALATLNRDIGNINDAKKHLISIQKIRPWDNTIEEFLRQLD